jgi:hypothetical protein
MMLFQPNPIRGFLRSAGLQRQILVQFQFNPTQVSDKRAVSYATLSAPGLLMPGRHYTQGGDRTISFSVHINGLFTPADNELAAGNPLMRTPSVGGGQAKIARDETGSIEPELNKYRAFLYPQPKGEVNWQSARSSFVPLYKEKLHEFASPPVCQFGMGEDRVIDCVVTDIGITETYFNLQLRPLRADVSVTLVEYVPYEDRVGA